MHIEKSLLSQPKPFTGDRTRIFETRYPKDILPPEYSAQVWSSADANGHYRTIGDFESREEAKAALNAYLSNTPDEPTRRTNNG